MAWLPVRRIRGRSAPAKTGNGWFAGVAESCDREFAVDVEQFFAFVLKTQPDETAKLGIADFRDRKSIARRKFLARVQGEISRRGTIGVLRHGIKHGALSFRLHPTARRRQRTRRRWRHVQTRFSITRQVGYSRRGDEAGTGPVRLHQRPAGDDVISGRRS